MIPPAWADLPFFSRDWPGLAAAIAADPRPILPPEHQRFAALALIPPAAVRVVILGQDPYPTPGHAHGLAFSVEPDVRPLPRSLSNIFKEMEADIGTRPESGDLRFWAHQGVLLLNTCLSVPAGEAGGHARLGWQRLAEEVLARVSQRPTAFLLWGGHAQALARHIAPSDHLILESAHPSPLSARRGFFGSRPFSRINRWLVERGEAPIRWA
ncbi:uracil-DNA glycosylase [Frigidibacter sp. SD6-1]|uniref:uracil-DNA glycosylase n=1 Tax=Frigidibacter sp. SD6-1 TaxID=3032581 RepID=UPI0024DF544A|nr:uracil-DNA glycosylase [Frigidibacter sp. SD6-1]